MTKKLLTVIGARPQFIKASPVSRALREADIEELLVHTGQHYDHNMSEVFFEELEIPPPQFNLGVGSGLHGAQTGQMLVAIEELLLNEKPEMLMVYGDTNSTLAGALAAVKLHIPVVHVEAGLRSFNQRMPEEINRVLTDHASDILFAPTRTAVTHLGNEGVPAQKIHMAGDVMYDAALYFAKSAQQQSQILGKLDLQAKQYALATIHRAENTDDPRRLLSIFTALDEVSEDCLVVLPLHPRTRAALHNNNLSEADLPAIRFVEPVGYLDMVMLQMHAALVITDSGGVQKEAYFHSVPCVTLREETEWVELVEMGWNRLVSPVDASVIAEEIRSALQAGEKIKEGEQPYGDGTAAIQIAALIAKTP